VAFLIVAVIWAIVAVVGVRTGQRRAKQIQAIPQTVETLKEDVEWTRQHKA
jgi:uncharacterized protein YoxC